MGPHTSPPRIVITGATGMLGSALTPFLVAAGYQVVPVSRRPLPGGILWQPETGKLDPAPFEGAAAVVHLAGENIAAARWSDARKAALRQSRIGPTHLLASTLAQLVTPPGVLISASAMGYYGDRGEELLTESSPPGNDFLATLVTGWEHACDPAREAGLRVAHTRFGIILTPAGGALAKMLPAARLGIGGALGSGDQWMSWIAIADVLGVVKQIIDRAEIRGPVNTVSPNPVRNREFAKTLGQVLHRPAVFPVPEIALKLLFGEMAEATLLASTRLDCGVLRKSGHEFQFPTLDRALTNLLRG